MKRITITVSPEGQATVETSGYKGKSCQDATREIEKALGKVTSDKKKAEYHQATTGQHLSQGN